MGSQLAEGKWRMGQGKGDEGSCLKIFSNMLCLPIEASEEEILSMMGRIGYRRKRGSRFNRELIKLEWNI